MIKRTEKQSETSLQAARTLIEAFLAEQGYLPARSEVQFATGCTLKEIDALLTEYRRRIATL